VTGIDIAYQEWKTRLEMRYIAGGTVFVAVVMLLGYARVL